MSLLLSAASTNAYEFPPYQGITLKLSGNISENYNNNITFASDEENKVEDLRTMLNLGLDFQYEGKTHFIGFSGKATRQIFEEESDVTSSSENIAVTFNNEFSEYDRISLRNSYTHTQEPGSSQGDFDINACRDYYANSGLTANQIESKCNEFSEEFGRFKGRFDSHSNNLSFTYSRYISETFDMSANYGYGQNWSAEEGTNDSESNSGGIRLNYRYSEPTAFSLSYDYQISSFEEGDDISRQSIKAGILQYITRRLYFNGSIGRDTVSSGENSIALGATLTSEIDENTMASLSFSQGTEISSNQEDTFKNWQISSNFTRLLTEDLNSSFSVFYGKGEYSESQVTDTLSGAGLNVSYEFWRSKRGANIQGNLGYSYSQLDSTEADRGYTRSSVNSSLTLAF